MPNPWDVGSTRFLQSLRDIVEASELPVNAYVGNGFALDASGVEVNVGLAIETGVAGLSIARCTLKAGSGARRRSRGPTVSFRAD
jgi:2-methylisocitrate lyase-like PEP mutase family enzyme